MKVLLLILILTISVFAKKETCYSVQVASEYRFQNYDLVNKNYYPKECKYMTIGRVLVVRCGCFKDENQAKKRLQILKKDYENAEVLKIYKQNYLKAKKVTNKVKKKKKKKIKINNNLSTKEILKKLKKELYEKKKKKEQKKKILKKKRINLADELEKELRLMLQVFLYKGDLTNAYKVASLGVKKYKKSLYWNQKMSEVCRWSGRSAESMKYLRVVYNLKQNKNIEDELIKYGIKTYQYENIEPLVLNRAKRNPTEENIDLLIEVYKNIGLPEKVIEILNSQYRKNHNKMLITKMLSLSLEIGDLELAKKYVDILELNRPYTQKDAALISRYYYVTHNMKKAYRSLLYVNNLNITKKADNIKYYELLSDLAWYLQKNVIAAKASKKLIDLNSARLTDYERAMFAYKDFNPKVATQIAKKAYKKFKLPYLFFTYANGAINKGNFKELKKFIKELEKDKNLNLLKDSYYWIIKAQLYKHYKQFDLVEKSLQYALKLSPDDFRVKLMLLSYYIDLNNAKKVKNILLKMQENDEIKPNMYLQVASAYFYLNDPNRASYYMDKLKELKSPSVKTLSFKFLQAYLYQSQDNSEAFMKTMQEIYKELKRRMKRNPKLKKKNDFLSQYLRVAIHILPADKFKKRLKKAKKYLSKQNYHDISYSFAIRHKAYEKSRKIYKKIQNKALWLKFSNSLIFDEHSSIENMLKEDLDSLAIGDVAQAAYDDGQKALSQTMAFKRLDQNQNSNNAYTQHLNFSKIRSHLLDIKIATNNRDPFLQNYININNQTYLEKGYYLYEYFDAYSNNSLDKTALFYVPSSNADIGVGLKKVFNHSYIKLDLFYYDALKNYFGLALYINDKITDTLVTNLSLGINMPSNESILLSLGGKKDFASINFIWSIMNSISLSTTYTRSKYYSQDSVYIGDGDNVKVSLSKQLRSGYPDMRLSLFYDYSNYKEDSLTKGVIDKMQLKSYAVLPYESYNIGLDFSYGMMNFSNYTRVWRPYFDLASSYNNVTQATTVSFNIGYGGKILNQDHLNIGFSRSEVAVGVGDISYELYLKYKFYYK